MVLTEVDLRTDDILWTEEKVPTDGDDHLTQVGFHPSGVRTSSIQGLPASTIKDVFGDDRGVLGALSTDGVLFEYKNGIIDNRECRFEKRELAFKVEHLAIQGNGKVCICTNDMKLHVFSSIHDLLTGVEGTCSSTLITPIVRLLGSATTFTILSSDGSVSTFGSGLHPVALGRLPDSNAPADEPCSIPFLGGIKIEKIASTGWLSAALSADQEVYIWGGHPAKKDRIAALPALDDDELVKLVELGDDIKDVSVAHPMRSTPLLLHLTN